MACAKCGAVNDAAARYCNRCGTPLTPSARALGPTAVGAPLPLVFALVCLVLVALVGVGGYLGFGLLQRAISAGKADPRPSVKMPPLPESTLPPAQGADAPDAAFLEAAVDGGIAERLKDLKSIPGIPNTQIGGTTSTAPTGNKAVMVDPWGTHGEPPVPPKTKRKPKPQKRDPHEVVQPEGW